MRDKRKVKKGLFINSIFLLLTIVGIVWITWLFCLFTLVALTSIYVNVKDWQNATKQAKLQDYQ
jgi:uncharacterized protein (DUF58 family)